MLYVSIDWQSTIAWFLCEIAVVMVYFAQWRVAQSPFGIILPFSQSITLFVVQSHRPTHTVENRQSSLRNDQEPGTTTVKDAIDW